MIKKKDIVIGFLIVAVIIDHDHAVCLEAFGVCRLAGWFVGLLIVWIVERKLNELLRV